MLLLHNVSKNLNGKRVLNSLNLTISPGEVHVLLGLSGSGKSTLLRILLGTIQADEGSVIMDGLALSLVQDKSAWASKIGYVPQGGGLFPHLTAAQNVSLMAKLQNWTPQKIDQRIHELRELVSLAPEQLKRYPKELSGGQVQRVSLMRALFLDPQVLLLDEPLGALDPLIRSELQKELRQIFRNLKKTVVLVTHDLGEAAYLGDRIGLIHDGEILQTGNLQELIDKPAVPFVSTFLNAQRTLEEGLK